MHELHELREWCEWCELDGEAIVEGFKGVKILNAELRDAELKHYRLPIPGKTWLFWVSIHFWKQRQVVAEQPWLKVYTINEMFRLKVYTLNEVSLG